jgi:hypothetical protein
MDDQTAYVELRTKMEKLLAYINASQPLPIGACFANGECTMTTQDDCTGRWFNGVECLVEGKGDDTARAAQELLGRIKRLLEYIHAQSGATGVKPCAFEAGGKTYSLEMTPQECAAVGGVSTSAKSAKA